MSSSSVRNPSSNSTVRLVQVPDSAADQVPDPAADQNRRTGTVSRVLPLLSQSMQSWNSRPNGDRQPSHRQYENLSREASSERTTVSGIRVGSHPITHKRKKPSSGDSRQSEADSHLSHPPTASTSSLSASNSGFFNNDPTTDFQSSKKKGKPSKSSAPKNPKTKHSSKEKIRPDKPFHAHSKEMQNLIRAADEFGNVKGYYQKHSLEIGEVARTTFSHYVKTYRDTFGSSNPKRAAKPSKSQMQEWAREADESGDPGAYYTYKLTESQKLNFSKKTFFVHVSNYKSGADSSKVVAKPSQIQMRKWIREAAESGDPGAYADELIKSNQLAVLKKTFTDRVTTLQRELGIPNPTKSSRSQMDEWVRQAIESGDAPAYADQLIKSKKIGIKKKTFLSKVAKVHRNSASSNSSSNTVFKLPEPPVPSFEEALLPVHHADCLSSPAPLPALVLKRALSGSEIPSKKEREDLILHAPPVNASLNQRKPAALFGLTLPVFSSSSSSSSSNTVYGFPEYPDQEKVRRPTLSEEPFPSLPPPPFELGQTLPDSEIPSTDEQEALNLPSLFSWET